MENGVFLTWGGALVNQTSVPAWRRLGLVSEVTSDPRATVVTAAVTVLERRGYAGVTVREIAERARVSTKTIYKVFESRDDLIVAAIERWMADHVYPQFTPQSIEESTQNATIRWARAVFEPWERNPHMLDAFHRARAGPYGSRLSQQAHAAIGPGIQILRDDVDRSARDVFEILNNVIYGLIARFTDGQITVAEIMPAIEQGIRRLVPDDREARIPDGSTG